jgi:hypothetical protein
LATSHTRPNGRAGSGGCGAGSIEPPCRVAAERSTGCCYAGQISPAITDWRSVP